MPILTHKCPVCGYIVEKFHRRPQKFMCEFCGNEMKVIPSVTGYRRDHTVSDA